MDDDDRLRSAMDALREDDRAHAPPFVATWRASARPRTRAPIAAALAMAAAVLLAIAILRPWSVREPMPVASLEDPEPLAFLMRPLPGERVPTPRLALEVRR